MTAVDTSRYRLGLELSSSYDEDDNFFKIPRKPGTQYAANLELNTQRQATEDLEDRMQGLRARMKKVSVPLVQCRVLLWCWCGVVLV